MTIFTEWRKKGRMQRQSRAAQSPQHWAPSKPAAQKTPDMKNLKTNFISMIWIGFCSGVGEMILPQQHQKYSSAGLVVVPIHY